MSTLTRRLETYSHTVERWRKNWVRPYFRQQMALLNLANNLGLRHAFTA